MLNEVHRPAVVHMSMRPCQSSPLPGLGEAAHTSPRAQPVGVEFEQPTGSVGAEQISAMPSLSLATQRRLERLYAAAENWTAAWGCSALLREVSIEFAEPNTQALGTLALKSRVITLNGLLLQQPKDELLHETLCHELAHAATAWRYGLKTEEHGVEWQEFMQKAGFTPRPHIFRDEIHGS